MATPCRRADPPLEQVLFEEPYRFDFFQAVRLLGRLGPGRAPVGRDGPYGREAVRFAAHRSLAFPAGAIHRLGRPDGPGAPPIMTVSFLGLTGPMGVLPHVYTELLLKQGDDGGAVAAFLDLFNHRMASLFHRIWEKYRVEALPGEDEPDGHGPARLLFDLIGLGPAALRGRHDFPDAVLLSFAGLFAQRHRPAVALEGMLREYFDLPIEVRQFAGRWLTLDPADRSTLGTPGANNALGVTSVLGARIWDEQGKIRLRVGPLTLVQYLAFLPDGPSYRPLVQMSRLFVGGEFDIDVQLVLKADEVPQCRLTSSGEGPRMARDAWLLGEAGLAEDVDDAVFTADV